MNKIKITPEMVRDIATHIRADEEIMKDITARSSFTCDLIRDGAQNSIFGNVDEKAKALVYKMQEFCNRLDDAANLLNYSAEVFDNLDRCILAGSIERAQKLQRSIHAKNTNLGDWNAHATDSEYAMLSSIWNDVANSDSPRTDFINKLRSRTPEDDPIHHIKTDQVRVVNNLDGFDAIVITDDDHNATVVFAGTHGVGDFIFADLPLGIGLPSTQLQQAKDLINDLSKEYKNITVTGHSLGGYLATEVTIDNSNVSKCVAFDPPGREGLIAGIAEHIQGGHEPVANEEKITTYVTPGIVNQPGITVGDIHHIEVPQEFTLDFSRFGKNFAHDIEDIYSVIDGNNSVENNWKNYDFPPVDITKDELVTHTEIIDKSVIEMPFEE